jgi:uncharacterized protein YdeI (YjbR/CyaY-like superfamily)
MEEMEMEMESQVLGNGQSKVWIHLSEGALKKLKQDRQAKVMYKRTIIYLTPKAKHSVLFKGKGRKVTNDQAKRIEKILNEG